MATSKCHTDSDWQLASTIAELQKSYEWPTLYLTATCLPFTHHHRFNARFSMPAQVGRFPPNELLHFILSCAHSAFRFKVRRSCLTHPMSFRACLCSLAQPPQRFCKWTCTQSSQWSLPFRSRWDVQTISVDHVSQYMPPLPNPNVHSYQHLIFCSWDWHDTPTRPLRVDHI